jgi:hypothetical protein
MNLSEWNEIVPKAAAIAALVVALSLAGRAVADDECWAPMTDWQPRQAVESLAKNQGWTVRRVTVHDGCYRVFGHDQTGKDIRVTLNPVTLEIINDRDRDDRESEDDHSENKHKHD